MPDIEAMVGVPKSDPEGIVTTSVGSAFNKEPKDGEDVIFKLTSDSFKEVVDTTIVNSNSNLIAGDCFIGFCRT